MERAAILNRLIGKFGFSSYLEIGVEQGVTFNQVEAKNKNAVDPDFKVDQSELRGKSFEVKSDDFFDNRPNEMFDLVFIDGLHTFDQSLRDFTRSLLRLSEGGVIIIDDCYPSDYLASLRSHDLCVAGKAHDDVADRNWMGDVFKTILFIHEFFGDVDYAYIQETSGIVAVWRAPRKVNFIFGQSPVADISNLDFADFRYRLAPKLQRKSLIEIIECIDANRKRKK